MYIILNVSHADGVRVHTVKLISADLQKTGPNKSNQPPMILCINERFVVIPNQLEEKAVGTLYNDIIRHIRQQEDVYEVRADVLWKDQLLPVMKENAWLKSHIAFLETQAQREYPHV